MLLPTLLEAGAFWSACGIPLAVPEGVEGVEAELVAAGAGVVLRSPIPFFSRLISTRDPYTRFALPFSSVMGALPMPTR